MSHSDPSQHWFARVQHDLVKRLLWTARDCRDLQRAPRPGELVASLIDEEGSPIDAQSLWKRLCEDAPRGMDIAAFGRALDDCVRAAARNDLDGVLALEQAFQRLRAGGSQGS